MTETPRQATRCSPDSNRVQRSFQGQLYTHKMKVIFLALISSPPLISKYHLCSFCAVSTFYLQKLILLFFPFWSDRGTLFVAVFARSPPHLQNVKDLKARIKGTFLINIFFFLKRFFLFKKLFFIIYKCSEGATELISFTRPDMRPMELAELIR